MPTELKVLALVGIAMVVSNLVYDWLMDRDEL